MCPVADISKGQLTQAVKRRVAALNREVVLVPDNMTNHFKTLDLTAKPICGGKAHKIG